MTKFPRAAAVEFTGRPVQLTDRQAFIMVLERVSSIYRTGKSLIEQMFYEISLTKMIDDNRHPLLRRSPNQPYFPRPQP